MGNKMNRENWINEALVSLNREKQEASPYLLTRLHAKLKQNEEPGFFGKMILYVNRPAVAMSILMMILAGNGWAIASKFKNQQKNVVTTTAGYREDFASTLLSVYDYENVEP